MTRKEVMVHIGTCAATCLVTWLCTVMSLRNSLEQNEREWILMLSEIDSNINEDMTKNKAIETLKKSVVEHEGEMQLLQENINILNQEICNFQQENNELKEIKNSQNIINEVAHYWETGEYIGALALMKESAKMSDDMELLYKHYSDEYYQILVEEADELVRMKQYEDAKKILVEGKKYIDNSSRLDVKINEIDEIRPVKLSSIKITSSRNFSLNTDKPLSDTIGNSYQPGNSFIIQAESEAEYGYGTFYVGQKYKSLSTTIAVLDSSDDRELDGWIEIYKKTGDEYSSIYASPYLSRTTIPIEVKDINMEGAEWIEIRYYNKSSYYSLMYGYLSLNILVAEPTLYY